MLILIHWPRFGPYHLARIRAARDLLAENGAQVCGFEIADVDMTYLWRKENVFDLQRNLVFPESVYENISISRMWNGVLNRLGGLKPYAIAVNGYSSVDSLAALAWCRRNGKKAILMTESKKNDSSRNTLKERFKKFVVKQFSAALCGGNEHKKYLEMLGMKSSHIFLGYDVVDNDYFWKNAQIARYGQKDYGNLPGLNSSHPFFLCSARLIKRKNIDGILQAYLQYRALCNRNIVPWNLIILGDGPERASLEQFALSNRIPGVTFAGFRQIDELPIYYGLASLFIHAAHQEQWGLVVNEAMASGLPVAVSRTCGCASELVFDGENGFLFNSRNSHELTEIMFKFSSCAINIEKMGKSSQEHISSWGPNRFAQGLANALFT